MYKIFCSTSLRSQLNSTESGLESIMDSLDNTARSYDMKIDKKKTKVIRIS